MKNDDYKFKEETFVTVPAFKEAGIPERCFVVHCGTDENKRHVCFLMPMGPCFDSWLRDNDDYDVAAFSLERCLDGLSKKLHSRIRVSDIKSFWMLFSYIRINPGHIQTKVSKQDWKILYHDSMNTYHYRDGITSRNAMIQIFEDDLVKLAEPDKTSLKEDVKMKLSNKLKKHSLVPFAGNKQQSIPPVKKKSSFHLEKYGRGSIIHMDNLMPDLIADENDMTSFIVLENDAAKETMTVIPTETYIIDEYFESEDDEEPLLRDPNMIQLIVEHLNRGLQNGRYHNCTLRLPTKEELQFAHAIGRKNDHDDYLIASVVRDGDRAQAYDLEDWSEIDLLPDCEVPTIKPVLTLPYTLVQYLLITKKKQKHIPAFLFDQYTKNYFTEIQLTAYQYIEKGYTVCPRCHSWNCECKYYH